VIRRNGIFGAPGAPGMENRMIGTGGFFAGAGPLSRGVRGAAIAAGLAAGLLALSANEASAQWRRGGGWGGPGAFAAGALGGFAAGALVAGAARPYPYYPYGPTVYDEPPPSCWFEPEDVWNGYRWVRRRVRVCQ